MTKSRFAVLACALLAIVLLQGCGDSGRALVRLGEAAPERRADFARAVARACAGYDGLDGTNVVFGVSTNASGCSVTVVCDKMSRTAFQSALSVAVTNLALEYPGLGFMMDDSGTWKILMPDDIQIPVSGGFGIGGE